MVKRVIIAILLLPVVEIVVFLIVAAIMGTLWAFLLMLATSLGGVMVLRRAGRARIARLRVAVADNDKTWVEANTGGTLTVLAGFLLFLPGFLTDLAGAALLVGPLRRRIEARFSRWVHTRTQADRSLVDLSPAEWRQVPDRELQNTSKDRNKDRTKDRTKRPPTSRSTGPARD